jgi:phosphonate transport system substrate-binding protein
MALRWTHRVAAGLAAVLSAALALSARAAAPDPLVLAIVPNRPPVEVHRAWTPFVERLSRDAGVRIELKLYERTATFVDDCDAGVPDLVFASPNMFFVSHRKQGWLPLVRGSASLRGVVYVRSDSPYQSVQDLQGKTIAFVGPYNLCSILVRSALTREGTPIEFRPEFLGSAINVAKSVLLGKADACATLDGEVLVGAEVDPADLRALFKTPPVASHPLAAHPRVPAAVRERIASVVLGMAATEEGRRLLASVRLADPVRASFDRDYQVFDEVDFERLARQVR